MSLHEDPEVASLALFLVFSFSQTLPLLRWSKLSRICFFYECKLTPSVYYLASDLAQRYCC